MIAASPRSADDLAEAVDALARGELVAFPTETVYGLGADATNPEAVRRLYAVKRRPIGHPVIAHIGRRRDMARWALDVPPVADALAEAFWPGPLTLVLQRRRGAIVDEVTGGRATVGLRVPDHPLALDLLDAFDRPVAAPSANRFGRVSPTTAADVHADLGADVAMVLDGGTCSIGVESTIVDCTGPTPTVLRLGGVTDAQLATVVGVRLAHRTGGEVAAPGTLASHYAPDARVVAVEHADRATVAEVLRGLAGDGARVGLLMPAPVVADVPPGVHVLAPPVDADDYAHVVYARLREADVIGLSVVVAVLPSDVGIGAAVRDRLLRAAALP